MKETLPSLAAPVPPAAAFYRRVAWALVALGVAARLATFFINTGFWYDEGWLIQNLQDKSYYQLTQGLTNDQAAPILYLWLLKFIYGLCGLQEFALRAPAILAAVGGMLLMLPLARRIVSVEALPWALVLLAVSDDSLIYAARTKPYAMDAMISMVLIYAAIRLRNQPVWKYILILGGMETGLFWMSYPSCFVYGGIAILGGLRLLGSLRHKDSQTRSTGILPVSPMGVSPMQPDAGSTGGTPVPRTPPTVTAADWIAFIAVNVLVAASMVSMLRLTEAGQRSDLLMAYWGDRGFPMGWNKLYKWPLDATYRCFEKATHPIGAFTFAMALVAVVSMWRNRSQRFALGLLGLPLLLNIAAACLKKYPWVGERITTYSLPLLILLAAEGWAHIVRNFPAWMAALAAKYPWALKRPPHAWRRVAVAFGLLMVAMPVGLEFYNIVILRHRTTHGRPLAMYALQHAREGDRIAIAGSNEFGIYLRKDCPVPVSGGDYTTDPLPALTANWNRCWLLVRSTKPEFRAEANLFLDRFPTIEHRSTVNADLYLLVRQAPHKAEASTSAGAP